jgi:outer membrane protein TolC
MRSYGALSQRAKAPRFVQAVSAISLLLLWLCPTPLSAQLSFRTAIDLALRSNPRVRMAQDDVNHAVAAMAESRDQFIPSVVANGGLGRAYGITLNVPTILTINTQSLVYNAAQPYYLRSAHAGLQAATLTLRDVSAQVEEDTANAWLSLEGAQQRRDAIDQEHTIALRLVSIVQDRLNAGIQSDIDLKHARRTELQIRLQELLVEDEIASLREQLAQLVGLPSQGLAIEPRSLPSASDFAHAGDAQAQPPDSPALLSLEANAAAKQDQALGDSRYAARPQFLFQAQYGRISPIDNVTEYYNLQGHYNTFEAGIQIVLPLLDKGHSARARETAADAMHARDEADNLRSQQVENRLDMRHFIEELSVKQSLAEVDLGIAQDDLATMLTEVNSHSGDVAGRPMNTEDEQNARLAERAKFVDMLNAAEQLRKAQISLLRQTGAFDDWLAALPNP